MGQLISALYDKVSKRFISTNIHENVTDFARYYRTMFNYHPKAGDLVQDLSIYLYSFDNSFAELKIIDNIEGAEIVSKILEEAENANS